MNIGAILIGGIIMIVGSIKLMFVAKDEANKAKAITSGESSSNNVQNSNNGKVKPPISESNPIRLAGGLLKTAPKAAGLIGKTGIRLGKFGVGAGLVGAGLIGAGIEAIDKQTGLSKKVQEGAGNVRRKVTGFAKIPANFVRKKAFKFRNKINQGIDETRNNIWNSLSDEQKEKINNAKATISRTQNGIKEAGRKVENGINYVGDTLKEKSQDAKNTYQQYKDAWGELKGGVSNALRNTRFFRYAEIGAGLIAQNVRNRRGGKVRVLRPARFPFKGRFTKPVDINYETISDGADNIANNRVSTQSQYPELPGLSDSHMGQEESMPNDDGPTVAYNEEKTRERLQEAINVQKSRGDKIIGSTFSKAYANAAFQIDKDRTLTEQKKDQKLEVLKRVLPYAPVNSSSENLLRATNSVYSNVNESLAQVDMENLRKAQEAAEKKNDTRELIKAEIMKKGSKYGENMREYVETFGIEIGPKGHNSPEAQKMMNDIYESISKPGGFQSEEAKAVFGADAQKMQEKIKQTQQANVDKELTKIVNSQVGDIVKNTGASLSEAREQYNQDRFQKALDTEMQKFAEANRPANTASQAEPERLQTTSNIQAEPARATTTNTNTQVQVEPNKSTNTVTQADPNNSINTTTKNSNRSQEPVRSANANTYSEPVNHIASNLQSKSGMNPSMKTGNSNATGHNTGTKESNTVNSSTAKNNKSKNNGSKNNGNKKSGNKKSGRKKR